MGAHARYEVPVGSAGLATRPGPVQGPGGGGVGVEGGVGVVVVVVLEGWIVVEGSTAQGQSPGQSQACKL